MFSFFQLVTALWTRDCSFFCSHEFQKWVFLHFHRSQFEFTLPYPPSVQLPPPTRQGQLTKGNIIISTSCLRRDRWPGCMQNKHSTVLQQKINLYDTSIFAKFHLENTWQMISNDLSYHRMVLSLLEVQYNWWPNQTNFLSTLDQLVDPALTDDKREIMWM